MGTLTNALMTLLLSWLRAIVSFFWQIADGGGAAVLDLFAEAWLPVSAVMILTGLVIDRLVWLFHYEPHKLLLARLRGRRRNAEDAGSPVTAARAARLPEAERTAPEPPAAGKPAQSDVPDEELGPYPGMRYNPDAAGGTRKYAPLPAQENPRGADGEAGEAAETPQEEYERKMAEYRREKAAYEEALAQYERDRAAYEAAAAARDGAEAQRPRRRRQGGA